MRVIKYTCLFIFMMSGIIMQTEIFQIQLWNCETAYWVASRYNPGIIEVVVVTHDQNIVSRADNAVYI